MVTKFSRADILELFPALEQLPEVNSSNKTERRQAMRNPTRDSHGIYLLFNYFISGTLWRDGSSHPMGAVAG